ncbi:MAG: hypothetical protein HY961_05305 [Ignavibacteriae bacterium]|nr:hypothetical protein [Ignavibacteriota bacterium]
MMLRLPSHKTLTALSMKLRLRSHKALSVLIITSIAIITVASTTLAQIGGSAGSYGRMGFGARGMGMGNALTAVTTGDIVGYYNPAALPFTEYRNISASFGILSFDRRLNFLSFTQPLKGRAGISAGIINSGVTDIDGRDSDGEPTGMMQTSENQAFLGFGTQLKNGLAIGINVKFLYHHLYTDVNSTTFGVDVGLLLPIGDRVVVGATGRDFISKYSWNTNKVYGEGGVQIDDKFPQLYTVGVSYKLFDSLGIASADVEFSSKSTLMLKVGVEVPLIPELAVRAGVDRIDLKEKGTGVRPAFGFSARKSFDDLTPALNYAFVLEPFATSGMHMISLSVIF